MSCKKLWNQYCQTPAILQWKINKAKNIAIFCQTFAINWTNICHIFCHASGSPAAVDYGYAIGQRTIVVNTTDSRTKYFCKASDSESICLVRNDLSIQYAFANIKCFFSIKFLRIALFQNSRLRFCVVDVCKPCTFRTCNVFVHKCPLFYG